VERAGCDKICTDQRGEARAPNVLGWPRCSRYCGATTRRASIFSIDGVAGSQPEYIQWFEPTLTRHGYQLKDLAEQFGARPAEIRALFTNQLQPERARELRERMLAAGLCRCESCAAVGQRGWPEFI